MAVFSGGGYEEVARWLRNFVTSHAKLESVAVEGVVDAEGAREGESYGVRLRLGDRHAPPLDQPVITLSYAEVAGKRGRLDWCNALAARVRALARDLGAPDRESKKSA